MPFKDAVVTCFTKYVDFSGRASRPEYWWFFLSYVLAYIAAAIIAGAIDATGLAIVIPLAFFLPLLSAAVRRLHDTDRSGWWYLIGLVPLVGVIILIVFLASEGTAGSNRYGAPPGASSAPGVPVPPPPA